MIVRFQDPDLERLFTDPQAHDRRMGPELIRSYRKVMQLLVASRDDQELRQFKSLHLEKLKGDRQGFWSLKLHGGDRLIVRFQTEPAGRVVVIIEIVDYH